MATLIEDLAKETHRVKTENGIMKGETENLSRSNSQISSDLQPLGSRFSKTEAEIETLKKNLGNLKDYVRNISTQRHKMLLRVQLVFTPFVLH